MIGKTILHYKILEKLGEGGMGVVYKAEDTKLERTVAIKFLPRHIASNDEERKRFEIEAKAAAALNHPNIATIHAIEEQDNEMFIVMEYIEGKELKCVIDDGQLTTDDVIKYSTQIVEGLQTAHEKGIVHRDIKSSNIMLSNKGQVKIMDFGLAKVSGGLNMTKTGTTVGTVAYMSPEQAQGGEIDFRTDIWSFGIVLYELLTGELPFKGDYEQAIVYSIINEDEPSVSQHRSDTPSALEAIVQQCLQKNKENRYQDLAEVIEEMRMLKENAEYSSTSTEKSSMKSSPTSSSNTNRRFITISSIILFIAVFTISYITIFNQFKSNGNLPAMKMVRLTSLPGEEQDPVLSPDGKSVAFTWDGPKRDNFDIYVKLVDAGDPIRLTDNPKFEDYPAWSPDGQYIAFVRSTGGTHDEIYTIPALGGNERFIAKLRRKDDGGICWSTDGLSIFFSDETEELGWLIFKVDVETSEIEQVTTAPEGEENLLDYTPRVSPDGQYMAFVRRSPATSADVYTFSFAEQQINRLTTDDLPVNGLSWTPDGKHIVFNSNRDGAPGLWHIERSGSKLEKIAVSGMTLLYPNISLSGNRMVYYEYQVNENIWKVNLENPQIQQPLQMATQHKHFAVISPDGSKIAYSSDRTGSYEIWVCDSEGSGHNQLTRINGANHQAIGWSPDSQYIVFSETAMGFGNRLYVVSVNAGKPRILTENAYLPGWSRDSQWIYFSSMQGMFKISVDGGERQKVGQTPTIFVGESWNGDYLYTSKPRQGRQFFQDLWRMPINSGEEELIIERDNYRWTLGSWAVARNGVYYVDFPTDTTRNINFYDFISKVSKSLFPAPKGFSGYLDVSPDEKWLIYLKGEQGESDIMLIENFTP